MKHYLTASVATIAMLNAIPGSADETLWAVLKQGGKVVLMRHAVVDRGNGVRHVPGDCSQEMNLSAAGRKQAQNVGEAFRARGISVGDVLASPYCRTMETAKLAFGKARASDAMRLIEGISKQEVERINAQAMKLIGGYKGVANLILVTHQPNIEAIALESLGNADILVLLPKGGEEFDVVGKLSAPQE